MVRQDFRLTCRNVSKLLLERERNPGVQLLAPTFEQAFIGRIPD